MRFQNRNKSLSIGVILVSLHLNSLEESENNSWTAIQIAVGTTPTVKETWYFPDDKLRILPYITSNSDAKWVLFSLVSLNVWLSLKRFPSGHCNDKQKMDNKIKT